jgi:nucleoside-diphosphate-sugar epimerase
MRIFLAGATGAIGRRLIPLLRDAGHSVAGMTRTASKVDAIRAAGADPYLADALDPAAVIEAVERAKPELIIHQLTAIPADFDIRKFEEQFAMTDRLRIEGTDNLLAAARSAGVRRFVAQSYTGWPYARTGGPVKTEEDPLDTNPPEAFQAGLRAIQHLETAVLQSGLEGIVLRYGGFYGPGTSLGEGSNILEQIREHKFPIVGGGTGIWSFLHIDDAARATVAAVDHGSPGIYNIADDEPAPVSEWLPVLAEILGAKPPMKIPAWMGRFAIGEHGIVMMTEVRGASNEKAKRELGWKPLWPTWREGFRDGLSEAGANTRMLQVAK